MASSYTKLIIGKMDTPEIFKSRRMKMDKPFLPPRKQSEQATRINALLEKAEKKAIALSEKRVASASEKTLFSIKIHPKSSPDISAYGNIKDKVKVIYEDKKRHTVLVQSESTSLSVIQRKVTEYTQAPVSPISKLPRHIDAIAPISSLHVATFDVIKGPNLRQVEKELDVRMNEWFEISCRGGKYVDHEEEKNSLQQIKEALEKLKIPFKDLVTYQAAEKLIIYLNVSLRQMKNIYKVTDCIFEVEYLPKQTFNWLLLERLDTGQMPTFEMSEPDDKAPVVTLLDSGINSGHPCLQKCISLERSVHPEDHSPVDDDGHGTLMAGSALHGPELSGHIRNGTVVNGSHWIESIRLYKGSSQTNSDKNNRPIWAVLTKNAVETAEVFGRDSKHRIYSLAITNELPVPGATTSWSLAVDEIAYNSGNGRLIFVSNGNYEPFNIHVAKNFPGENLLKKLEDPAHAVNALTVSGYTNLNMLPPDPTYQNYQALSPIGGISPHNLSGKTLSGSEAIKPDIVFEAGNGAFDNFAMICDVPTMTEISTCHDLNLKYAGFWGTSLATALASNFAARLWKEYPQFRPETIRGLIVHSADWTSSMKTQAGNSKDDLLALCGYGVPNFNFASECAKSRATIVIEDALPNARKVKREFVEEGKERSKPAREREMKTFALPIPEEELLQLGNKEVELRITLSYFSEPNYWGGNKYRGMDILWDIQGPFEEKENFLKRVNEAKRKKGDESGKSFEKWDIGPLRRRRGTVQSDRWRGPASELAGDKLIAVYPKYGWWNERREFIEHETKFSLIATIVVPDLDILAYVRNRIEIGIPSTVEVAIKQN